jgi:hypothetical protein
LLKRFKTIAVAATILMVPALAFSADAVAPKAAVAGTDNTVTIPLELTNQDGLVVADIPLKFSEGATLKEVSFEGTRAEYFDLKSARIDNNEHTVLLGLVPQITPEKKAPLEAGTGVVANLIFTVNDPTVSEITLEQYPIRGAGHVPMLVYNTSPVDGSRAFDHTNPEIQPISVALTGVDGLPDHFALDQNYPNPFNPSTSIAFALPVASHVELDIFNVVGQKVANYSGDYGAGEHTIVWDGRSTNGSGVASGVYFYRIATDTDVATRKMMLLK